MQSFVGVGSKQGFGWRVVCVVTLASLATALLGGCSAVQPTLAPPEVLYFGTNATSGASLDGSTVSGTITVYVDAKKSYDSAAFYVDDSQMKGQPAAVDSAAPFQMVLDTTALSNGTHGFTVDVTVGKGGQKTKVVTQASFTVANTGTGTNAAPVVDAGPDQTVVLGDGASLDGKVSDDGLPSGQLTVAWSEVSGPGSVVFADAAAAVTTAAFSAAGSYTLRLTADDGSLTSSDDAVMTVTAPAAVSVAISPTSASLSTGGTTSFTATVSNASDTSVTWKTDGGSVTGTGNTVTYTAPGTAGTYQVTATSNQDGSKSATASVTVSAATAGVPRPDHVVIVIEENHSYSDIHGSSAAPYMNGLASSGALFTQSFAIEHPSEPNYLDLFSGSNQGVTDDSCPHTFTTPDLGDALLDAGFTFGAYSEDLPSAGSTVCSNQKYARKHDPWVNWPSIPGSTEMPFTSFPTDYTTLPDVSFVIPNLDNDMHDGSISRGDTWLKDNIGGYAQWALTHNSLLIVTFDEGSGSNQIFTVFYGQNVTQGSYSEHIDHFDLLRTLVDMYGLTPMGSASSATPITDVWGGG